MAAEVKEAKKTDANELIKREIYIIEADQMKNVNTYVPANLKTVWVKTVATKCITKCPVKSTLSDEMDVPIPSMYKEDSDIKYRYMMGFFSRAYLGIDWERAEDEDEWLMPYDEYDKWMGGHIFSQIEKHKQDKDLKDICFNVLAEYKDVERRLNNEIYGNLQIMNDPVSRYITFQQASMTPEAMDMMLEGLEKAKDALQEYQETRAEVLEPQEAEA